ncbi:hypothetical protein D3C76_880590 [compost metagenome]
MILIYNKVKRYIYTLVINLVQMVRLDGTAVRRGYTQAYTITIVIIIQEEAEVLLILEL